MAAIAVRRGRVVGHTSLNFEGYHATAWVGSQAHELGLLDGGGTFAEGLNDFGTVVGWSGNQPSRTAVVWYDLAPPAFELNSLLDAEGCLDEDGSAGYNLEMATAVNNDGTIVAVGAYWDRDGERVYRLFKLTRL